MRVLRFVGPGEDANYVILETADGAERFALHLDMAMRAVASPPPPPSLPGHAVPQAQTGIGPREIQVRVRAGTSPQELAEEHGMTLERVLRFAGPVLAERARITDEARRARARRSTTEGQTVVLGEAVDSRFTAHGIDPSTVTWDAYRREDGKWIVTASWVGGEAARIAEWVFHLATRNVTPLDDSAADLLSDRPIRPATPVEKPARPSLVAAPRLAPGVVAFPPMPDAHTGPLPSAAELDEVFDQDAMDEGPGDAAAQPTAAQRAKDAADYHAPPLPLRLAEADLPDPDAPDGAVAKATRLPKKVATPGRAGPDGESVPARAARGRVPSWDDILLGVRRKSD